MTTIIELDGVPIDLQPPDYDRDGIIGGKERIPQKIGDGSITNINQSTEVGEVMRTMFPEENISNTKMLGNISANEEQFILAFLILRTLGVTPFKSRDIVMEKLLLSVSRDARGRDDGRDIMIGKREQDVKVGAMGKIGQGISSFFGGGGR